MVDVIIRKASLCALVLLISGCAALAPPEDWSRRDTAMLVSFQALNAMDAHTTQRIHKTPGVSESKYTMAYTVLGPQPDPNQAFVYFATRGLVHYMILRALPKKWRPWFSGAHITETLVALDTNCESGLC